MLSPLRYRDEKREDGFTLIELLVVVIIIGILAAIAIPVFLNQRQNAWRSAVESDLRNAAIQIETVLTREGTYPATFTATNGGTVQLQTGSPLADVGIQVTASENVTISYTAPANASDPFTITGTHSQLPAAENTTSYNSGSGGLAGATWGAAPAPPQQ